MDFITGAFFLSISVFVFNFIHYSCLFDSVQQIKLAFRQFLVAYKYTHRIISV